MKCKESSASSRKSGKGGCKSLKDMSSRVTEGSKRAFKWLKWKYTAFSAFKEEFFLAGRESERKYVSRSPFFMSVLGLFSFLLFLFSVSILLKMLVRGGK